jgi:tetratricopeptide (TPR) repeat protein
MKTLIALVLVLLASQASSQDELSPAEIYSRASSSVVMILRYDTDNTLLGYGSGVIVSTEGLVYTNYHLINETPRIVVRSGDTLYDSIHIAGFDPFNDAAMLRLPEGSYPAIEIAPEGGLTPGMQVFALGNPKGYTKTFSSGVLSSLRNYDFADKLQFTAPISPGSSGGALLNSRGELIGITSSCDESGQNLNFGIPVIAYTRCLTIDPEVIWHRKLLRGMLELYENSEDPDSDDPLDIIDRYISLYSNDTAKWEFAGKFYQSRGYYENAAACFTSAIELKPQDAKLYKLRAECYGELSDTLLALEDFAVAIRLNSNYSEAYFERAEYYEYTLKDYRLALEDYERVVRLEPEKDYVYNNTANCRLALNDKVGAISELTKSLVWSGDALKYYMRADIYEQLGMYEEAISDYTYVLTLNPQSKSTLLDRAILYSKLEENESAIADYLEYLRCYPRDEVAHNNLAYCYMECGETELAEKHFKRALANDKYHVDSHIGLAILYFTEGRTKLVVENMCRAIELKKELMNGMPGLAYMETRGWFWGDDEKQVIKKIFRLMGIADTKVEIERNVYPRAQRERAVDAEE